MASAVVAPRVLPARRRADLAVIVGAAQVSDYREV